jgi:methylmalonyl-CoA mutase N-terminal domain/subunit
MIAAIEAGFPQTEIASASYRYQREIESGARTIVGVNRFQSDAIQSDAERIELLHVDEAGGRRQIAKLAALRARRDNGTVQKTLDALRRAAEGTENTMPFLLDAVRAYATLGEICDALRGVFGTYQETSHI